MKQTYHLCYKQQKLGQPMNKVDAEAMLQKMSRCFENLEIVENLEEEEKLNKSG